MKILSTQIETVKLRKCIIKKDEELYTLGMYIDSNDKVIDADLRDEDGITVQDPALLAEIETFLHNIEIIQEPLNSCDMDSAPKDRPIWAFTGSYWGWFYWCEDSKNWMEQGHQRFMPNNLVCWKQI